MLRPLNSAIARITVRMSAPSTSTVKVPEPVRTRPTCLVAVCASAPAASTIVRTRPTRTLAVRIRLFSLPRQWNRNRLRLPVDGDVDDHGIPLETLDVAVHDLVTAAQHVAVAASVFDHRELIAGAPHDPHDLESAEIRGRLAADVDAHEVTVDQRLERIPASEGVV